jgi:hypothetical protein
MKRIPTLTLAALAATALFGGLVYTVLVAAHVSEPAAATVYGLTPRRVWATAAVALALSGVVIGGLAVRRLLVVSAPVMGDSEPSWPSRRD